LHTPLTDIRIVSKIEIHAYLKSTSPHVSTVELGIVIKGEVKNSFVNPTSDWAWYSHIPTVPVGLKYSQVTPWCMWYNSNHETEFVNLATCYMVVTLNDTTIIRNCRRNHLRR
jgi:hypothetical protein